MKSCLFLYNAESSGVGGCERGDIGARQEERKREAEKGTSCT